MTESSSDILGVVLSGGSSRRFGSDKALTTLDGRALIEHVYDALSRAVPKVVVSVGSANRTYHVPSQYVIDQWQDVGPLSGIASALSATETERIFVVAADLPRIRTESITAILDGFQRPITIARNADSGRLQPLCGVWHRDILDDLTHYILDGGRTVMAFLDMVDHHTVDIPPAELANINRPTDVRAEE